MPHPYPPRWAAFSYVGRHDYSLTFVTDQRHRAFVDAETVDFVRRLILRAGAEKHFAVTAYCFMPDHAHLVVSGCTGHSNCRSFIKAAKQYSAYYYSQRQRARLWERYGYEHVIRDAMELAMTVRYILSNPVRAGLVKHPRDYPFLGSSVYSVDELLRWCEYTDGFG